MHSAGACACSWAGQTSKSWHWNVKDERAMPTAPFHVEEGSTISLDCSKHRLGLKKTVVARKHIGHSDTDWTGCSLTRRRTNATVMIFGAHIWLTQSSTQTPISLSCGEKQFYGLVKTSSRAIYTHNVTTWVFQFYGSLSLEVVTDSAAAKGIAVRRGLNGCVTWKQTVVTTDRMSLKRFVLTELDGQHNIADVMTTHVDKLTFPKHLGSMSLKRIFPTKPYRDHRSNPAAEY